MQKKVDYVLVVLMCLVLQVGHENRIVEFEIGYARTFYLRLVALPVAVTVADSADRHFFELHVILGQSSGLVSEQVVNLTEFLVECTRLHDCLDAALAVDHVGVPLNVEGLEDFRHFHSNNH